MFLFHLVVDLTEFIEFISDEVHGCRSADAISV